MNKHKITIHCCFCSDKSTHIVELPDGWAHQYDGHDNEDSGFCPKHAGAKPFTDSQCVGCVGGWGQCDLWKGFAYTSYTLTDKDIESLQRGICPKRTNGTFSMSPNGVEDIDLTTPGDAAAGSAVADAILDYIDRYQGIGRIA